MRIIYTDNAPAAIGPYSQAIVHGDLVMTSGQIAIPPGQAELLGDTAAEQARVALRNLAAVLEAAGSDLGHAIKCTVFLADMADFPAVNEVYAQAFGEARPARSTVAVRTLPKGALVEVDCVAALIDASR